jgi:hypothetical protein
MNDGPLLTRTNPFAAEADGGRTPSQPTLPPPELPRVVAMQIAKLARIPAGECERFCDSICWKVRSVWDRDRRAVGSKPGRALLKAAKAARTLHEAVWSLNEEDSKWVEKLAAHDVDYRELPQAFLLTVSLIDGLFSTAINKSFPISPAKGGRRGQDVWRTHFRDLIFDGQGWRRAHF